MSIIKAIHPTYWRENTVILLTMITVVIGCLSFTVNAKELPEVGFLQSEIERLNEEAPKNDTLIGQYETLLSRIESYAIQQEKRDDYQKTVREFPIQRKRLQQEIDSVDQLDILTHKVQENYSDLAQSSASLQAAISEWQINFQTNSDELTRLNGLRTSLPKAIAALDSQLDEANILKTEQGDDIVLWLDRSQFKSIQLQKEVMTVNLKSLDERIELLRLEQQLLDQKITLATPRLAELQDELTDIEQEPVRMLISQVRQLSSNMELGDVVDSDSTVNADVIQKLEQLEDVAQELEQVLDNIDLTRNSAQQIQSNVVTLTAEQRLIKDNLNWLRKSTAFGASIRAQLRRLPSTVEDKQIPDQIANSHIRKYELGQIRSEFERTIETIDQKKQNVNQRSMSTLTIEVLNQLFQHYDTLILELGKLQVVKNQYEIQVESARAFLKEQQLWVRSNVPLWENLTQFDNEVWFGTSTPITSMLMRITHKQLLLTMLGIVLYSLVLYYFGRKLSKSTSRFRIQYQKIYGHPLKDRFQHTIILLLMAVSRSLSIPIWYGLTAVMIFSLWPLATTSELVNVVLASAIGLFVLEFIYALSFKKGVLNLHLGWPDKMCLYLHHGCKRLRWPLMVILLLIFWSELLSGEVEVELSRVLFLILIGGMTLVYAQVLKDQHLPSVLPAPINAGIALLLVRTLILGAFLAIIIMAIMGLYVAAWVLLIYQQFTIAIVLGALLIYQLGERWLTLEYRQLNYQRLLAKRAELVAHQQEQANASDEFDDLREVLPNVEDHGLGSEQISEQSLTLLRGLSLIGLVIAVIALWSSALEMTSWLNDIVVWQVKEATESGIKLADITLQSVLYGLITLLITFFAVRNLPGVLELLILRRLKLAPGTGYAVTTLVRYLILTAGILVGFATIGFQWSSLQWLVAAFGVGLGFGLQEIFANFISGLILLFERPIRIGDIVTINDLSGKVSKIQTRATTIIDWDNKEIVVPNKSFITEKLINWSLTDPVTRIVIPLGVAYGSDVERVEKLLYEIAESHPLVLTDPSPSVFFLAFGASSLDFELRVHITAIDLRLTTIHSINKSIDALFKEHNIEIAFPQMDIHVKDWPGEPKKE